MLQSLKVELFAFVQVQHLKVGFGHLMKQIIISEGLLLIYAVQDVQAFLELSGSGRIVLAVKVSLEGLELWQALNCFELCGGDLDWFEFIQSAGVGR